MIGLLLYLCTVGGFMLAVHFGINAPCSRWKPCELCTTNKKLFEHETARALYRSHPIWMLAMQLFWPLILISQLAKPKEDDDD